MNEYQIYNETKEEVFEIATIEKVLAYALEKLSLKNVIFNIIIVDKEKIHELNRTYRGVDRPTDVISFALEDDDTSPVIEVRSLGDIYICLEKAREQATDYGHSFLRELCFLSIHGLLHLLGYDHMNKEEEKVMFSLQEEILNGYGITREN